MKNKNVIIVGSGIGGLATAIRLAVLGYSVDIFEKNEVPGGKLSAFEINGFHFDKGPSLFTQPTNIEELFELAGEPISEYFWYKPVEIAFKYFFENGKIVNAYTNSARFAGELNEKLGEQPESITGYLNDAAALYHKVGHIFLNYSLHKKSTWLNKRILNALPTIKYA